MQLKGLSTRVRGISRGAGRRRSDRPWLGRVWRRRLGTILRWVAILDFVYVFAFPLLFMLGTSFKSLTDLNDPTVRWITTSPTVEGYRMALEGLNYSAALRGSVTTCVLAALGQTLVGAMVAYAFARLPFPGRGLLFGALLFTIVVPVQVLMIPQFMLYSKLKWINTYIPLVLPAFMGWGVRGGILLIVYRQFMKALPYELEDAASVDGAGVFRTFWQVMFPLAKPAVLVVMLFSVVWSWNDFYQPWMVLHDEELFTLPQRMYYFLSLLNPPGQSRHYHFEENMTMAAVTLTVAPMLLLYLFAQRYFTQSIDRTGLVE